MPRVTVAGFIGPTNRLQALVTDPERTINQYPENTPPGIARVRVWLVPTPGLEPWVILNDSPIRGEFQQDGRAFAVGGGTFYEVFNPPSSTSYGSLASDAYLASICSNGSAGDQMLIVSGGNGYVFTLSTNTLGSALGGDFPSNVRTCDFMDGYGLVAVADSRHCQYSALEDFTSWDALDFFERSEASDNVVVLIRCGRNIWLLGSKTSEIWYDSGDALDPFMPIQGTFIDHGCAAPFSAQRIGSTLVWLSRNELGEGEVVIARGYQPEQISTYSIASFITAAGVAADGDLSQARAWTYQENGHSFYCLVIPDAESTLVVDLTMNQWHERARWTGSAYIAHVVQTHMIAFGQHLVGDRFSGAIYRQSLSLYSEEVINP